MRVPTTIRKITVPATMAITAPTLIVCNEILAISTDGVVLASGLVERDWTADFEVAGDCNNKSRKSIYNCVPICVQICIHAGIHDMYL